MAGSCVTGPKSIGAPRSKSCCPEHETMHPKILLVEDDLGTASALRKVLQAEGYGVDLADRGDSGLAQAKSRAFDLVLTDLKLPGICGMELAAQLRVDKPKLPIIIMTAHGTTDTAIEATKLGAYEYLIRSEEHTSELQSLRHLVCRL